MFLKLIYFVPFKKILLSLCKTKLTAGHDYLLFPVQFTELAGQHASHIFTWQVFRSDIKLSRELNRGTGAAFILLSYIRSLHWPKPLLDMLF